MRVRIAAVFTSVAFTLVFVFPGCGRREPAVKAPPPFSSGPAVSSRRSSSSTIWLGQLQQAADALDRTEYDIPALAASLGPDAEKIFTFVRDQTHTRSIRGCCAERRERC